MRKLFVFLILVVVAVGGKFIYNVVTKPDDKTLIKQALADAIKASKEGRSGSVIDKLTDNFKVNGQEPGAAKIVDLVKNSRPDVVVKDNDPVVSGDTAQITSDVSVKVNYLGMPFDRNFKDVQLFFRRESGTEWLIVPTSTWHLAAARVSEDQLGSLGQ